MYPFIYLLMFVFIYVSRYLLMNIYCVLTLCWVLHEALLIPSQESQSSEGAMMALPILELRKIQRLYFYVHPIPNMLLMIT